jgi:hypothetical protein
MTDEKVTPAELRELPQKDSRSDDEALALYKDVEGFETVCGAPTPFYVESSADRVRWSHCARLALTILGEPASGQLAGQLARPMFTDHDKYGA